MLNDRFHIIAPTWNLIKRTVGVRDAKQNTPVKIYIWHDKDGIPAHLAAEFGPQYFIDFAPESWDRLNDRSGRIEKRQAYFISKKDEYIIQGARRQKQIIWTKWANLGQEAKNSILNNPALKLSVTEKQALNDHSFANISGVKTLWFVQALYANDTQTLERFETAGAPSEIITLNTLDAVKIHLKIQTLGLTENTFTTTQRANTLSWVYREGTWGHDGNCTSLLLAILNEGGLRELVPTAADKSALLGLLLGGAYMLAHHASLSWADISILAAEALLAGRWAGGAYDVFSGLKALQNIFAQDQGSSVAFTVGSNIIAPPLLGAVATVPGMSPLSLGIWALPQAGVHLLHAAKENELAATRFTKP